jgi:hypothetical protein
MTDLAVLLAVGDELGSGSPARLPGEIPDGLTQDVALLLQLPDPATQLGLPRLG